MLNHNERRFWRGMFISYISIIFLCFSLYVVVVAYDSFQLGRERYELEDSKKLEAVRTVFDTRLESANKIISSINYSESVRTLHKVLVENAELTSSDYSAIQIDLRRSVATLGNFDVDELLLFLNGQNRVFSSLGALILATPFNAVEYPKPYLYVSSVAQAFAFDSDRVTMQKQALLYCDDFKYYGGTNRGVIVVNLNLDRLKKDVEKILGKQTPYKVIYQGNSLFPLADDSKGTLYEEIACTNLPNLKIQVFFPAYDFFISDYTSVFLPIGVGLAFSLIFLLLAFFYSQKYYKPIKEITQLMPEQTEETSQADGIDKMIENLKGIIGVYAGYQETLTTISPYIEQGMLHGMMVNDYPLSVSISRKFLNLEKPYYYICAVNFSSSDEKDYDISEEAAIKLDAVFSNEELKIYYYRTDRQNYFLIINIEKDEGVDDLIARIQKFLTEFVSSRCSVTIGVDDCREDISEFKEACSCALSALANMVSQGKGDVYFYEKEMSLHSATYYFVPNADVYLTKFVRDEDIEGSVRYLEDILRQNEMRYELSASSVAALADELHYTCMKVVRNLHLLNTNIQIEKVQKEMTLAEIFTYYEAVLKTLIEEEKKQKVALSSDNLSMKILDFVDENFTLQQLSLSYLMDTFDVSSKYISLLYKKQATTYLQYVTNKRILYAQELILAGNVNFETISQKVGYGSVLTFRRNFKLITGVTPSEFREKHNLRQ
nr:AraC family transcriptional regulator [uncultured Sphaerochaeta sp.]